MPSVGVLLSVKDETNEHNHFAISVMKDGFIVGHVYCLLIFMKCLIKKSSDQDKCVHLTNSMHLIIICT